MVELVDTLDLGSSAARCESSSLSVRTINRLMPMQTANFFEALPDVLDSEQFATVLNSPGIRIERIVSQGHTSPAEGWYDQDEHEWVMVLQGGAVLAFENSADVRLAAGDYLNIPAHCRHRVAWTDPDQTTVWLAVFYSAA